MRLLLSLATSLAMALPAMADQRCKSVDFSYENQIDRMIRIERLYYFDVEDDKNRSRNIRNRNIASGGTIGPYNESLPYVGAEPIARFFVKYRECLNQNGSTCSSWSSARNSRGYIPDPAVTSCSKNMDILIKVTRVGQFPT